MSKELKKYLVNCCWIGEFNKHIVVEAENADEAWARAFDDIMIPHDIGDIVETGGPLTIDIDKDDQGRVGWGNPDSFFIRGNQQGTTVLREVNLFNR